MSKPSWTVEAKASGENDLTLDVTLHDLTYMALEKVSDQQDQLTKELGLRSACPGVTGHPLFAHVPLLPKSYYIRGPGTRFMPVGYPLFELPSRPCQVFPGNVVHRPEVWNVNECLTGRLGTLVGFDIVTDSVCSEPVDCKYRYGVLHRKSHGMQRVSVYVYEARKRGLTYWYEYPSARVARAEMKKHGIKRCNL